MEQLLSRLLYEMENGQDAVLATVLESRGSSPRGAGSQMLVTARGRILGTIGGGSVEKNVETLSRALLEERRSAVHEFILRQNGSEDIGMVCGGNMTVHMQFIPAADAAWRAVAAAASARLAAHEAGFLLLREDGGAPSLTAEGCVVSGAAAAQTVLSQLSGGCFLRAEGIFALPLPVGERAILFGGGHVSQALAPLLRTVGFRPVVMDNRPEFASRALFPMAEEVICGDYLHIAEHLTVTAQDFAVVLTNGHVHDYEVQHQLLRGDFAYLGAIGSRTKTAVIQQRLREDGIPQAQIDKIHTPVGTAIRAVTPAEIAVSIAGEMILVRATARDGAK